MLWLSPPSPHPNVLHAFVDQDEPGHKLSAFNGRDSFISLETSTHTQASQHITLSSSKQHSTAQHSTASNSQPTKHIIHQSRVVCSTLRFQTSQPSLTQKHNQFQKPPCLVLALALDPCASASPSSFVSLDLRLEHNASSHLSLSCPSPTAVASTAHSLPLVSNRPKSITTSSHPLLSSPLIHPSSSLPPP